MTFKTHLPSHFSPYYSTPVIFRPLRLHHINVSFQALILSFPIFLLLPSLLISSFPLGSHLLLNNSQTVFKRFTRIDPFISLFSVRVALRKLGKPVFPPKSQSCSLLFSSPSYNVSFFSS